MSAMQGLRFFLNSSSRRVLSLLGGLNGSPKHDHYSDFGWPETVTFEMLKNMWERNALGRAAVEAYIEKIWEDDPQLFEIEADHPETALEKNFRVWAEDLRLWSKMAEADRRGMVGDYAGLIIQVADGLQWNQPMGLVRGLQDVWNVIPVWEDELTVAEWNLDETSRRYGEPLTYTYQEQQRPEQKNVPPVKSVTIHHSRVLLWSSTGDLEGRSILRPGYNSMLDVEKVMGGGAEGFWKNARSSLTLNMDPNANLEKLARVLGVDIGGLGDKLNEVADDFSKGFDKALVTQGIEATPVSVAMPQPEEFQDGPMKMFAASVRIPIRVLIGNVTGERASTEDEKSWAKRCNGLRDRGKKPLIKAFLNRLEVCGALPKVNWFIDWPDLTEGTTEEKLDAALKLSEMNSKSVGTGEAAPFSANDIREAAGYEAEEDPEFDEGVEEVTPPVQIGPDGLPIAPVIPQPGSPPLGQQQPGGRQPPDPSGGQGLPKGPQGV